MTPLVSLVAGTLLVAACNARGALTVMTYNVYLGTNLDPVMAAAPPDVPLAAAQAWAEAQQTNFPERAGKLAEQIAAARADLVGLQEVALWRVRSPGDAAFGGTVSATRVRYDFLRLILDSLRARRLAYVAAASEVTSDIEVPVVTGVDAAGNPTFDDVRFTDRDAILVRAGVSFSDPRGGKFDAYIPISVGGIASGIYRGWCSVMASAGETAFRFVTSHLEAESPDVNLAQATELTNLLARDKLPVIWVGDFNADANTATPSYARITGAGFADLWPLAHPRDPGLTNGPADGVGALNAAGVLVPYTSLVFDARIDLILLRDSAGRPRDVHLGLLGDDPADRTVSGLGPSDHAAVAATFRFPLGRPDR
jgi:hypothetical protein